MLLAAHQRLIDASAISAEVAAARGYRSVTTKSDLKGLGFAPAQRRIPALLMPIYDCRGEIVTYHLRCDEPRVVKGRALKYETPKGSRMAVDVPPTGSRRIGGSGGAVVDHRGGAEGRCGCQRRSVLRGADGDMVLARHERRRREDAARGLRVDRAERPHGLCGVRLRRDPQAVGARGSESGSLRF